MNKERQTNGRDKNQNLDHLLIARTLLSDVLTSAEVGAWGTSEGELKQTIMELSPELLIKFTKEAYLSLNNTFSANSLVPRSIEAVLKLLGGVESYA